jgi:hypothetical protein
MPGVDNKSEEAICNLALGHLGVSEEINNLTTERSATASACRRYFTTARDIAQRWGYSYRYPSGCLYFRRILSGTRNETSDSRIPYRIASDDIGKLIYTDKPDAECEFTKSIDNILLWPDDLILAVSFLLAGLIAPRVTRGDGVKLGDRAMAAYAQMKSMSEANAEGEEQAEENPEAESIRARS